MHNFYKTLSLPICLLLCFSIKAQLKADFSVTSSSGCTPQFIRFNDSSTGNPTSWKWDLGNGTKSTRQNPSTIYITPGVYTVKLIVRNSTEIDSIVKENLITIYAKPDIKFTASPSSGCPPLDVKFGNQTVAGSGSITEQVWDFGDGQISTDFSPKHIYANSGNYSITLTAENSFGCRQTLTKDSLIDAYKAVTADFDYTYSNACQPPALVKFNNLTAAADSLTFEWDFGDGSQISGEKNPQHTYTNTGIYQVVLSAKTLQGCTGIITKSISIGIVTPDFLLPEKGCINTPSAFINISSPIPISASWSFGDGLTSTGVDAVHTYTSAGTYNIKMTADFGNCSSSINKTIIIIDKTTPSFTTSGSLVSCMVPNIIHFNNTSSGAVNYKWFFGDGDSSLENNPIHTYLNPGYFTVTMIAFNNNGCSDTLISNNLIKIGVPKILEIQNFPFQGCLLQSINPKAIIESPEPITSYLWDFGDGSTSTDSLPVYQYINPGNYNVTLIVTTISGCSDTLTVAGAVKAGNLPTPAFTANPLTACYSTPIQFTDKSTANIDTWVWDFGDGTISYTQNPQHVFIDTGYFSVTLTVTSNGCQNALTIPNYIHIDPPISDFTATITCTDKFTRNFKDESKGAQTWAWDFGDGQTSTAQNAAHTYADTGKYLVKLTITNSTCTNLSSQTINIINQHPSFSYSPVSDVCKYTPINFNATGYAPVLIKSLSWNFGDDSITVTQDSLITHSYLRAGTFSPYLVATDLNGCNDTTANNLAGIRIFGPSAKFSNPEGTCLNRNIVFTDQSAGDGIHPITQWIWSYGDNTAKDTLTGAPFSHQYDTTGTFNVKLELYDNYGCKDSIIKNNAVVITKPIANFSLSDSLRCTTSGITFLNGSAGLSLKSLWNFGDGTTSAASSPFHTYQQQGLYTVKLNITDKFGCTDSITKIDIATISDPQSSFILTDTFGLCPPLLIQPINTSQNYSELTWYFDDGATSDSVNPIHYYNTAGEYKVRLVVKGFGECYDTSSAKVILKGPSGSFSYLPTAACSPSPVTFTASTKNTVRYIWDFNNGDIKNTKDSIVTYTYFDSGLYLPKLILIDAAGCAVNITNNDSIAIIQPTAFMKILQQTACDSALVSFNDSSIAGHDFISAYQWNFGDDVTSSAKNPTHYYRDSGMYTVSLIVTTSLGCKDTVQTPANIQVHKSPILNISALDSSCISLPVNFSALQPGTIGPLNWFWNFGDGSSPNNEQSPSHTYNTVGSFNVNVSATNQFGCSDTSIKSIQVIQPYVNAGTDSFVCLQNSIVLQATGSVNYTWLNTGNSLSCKNCANPIAQPITSTIYYVQGIDNAGCVATDSVFIEVKQPAELVVSPLDTLCAGGSIKLSASGAEIYKWSPSSGLSNSDIPNPVASPNTSTTYTLVGTDDKACFTDTASIFVHVFPIPTFDIIDTSATLSLGSTYAIKTINSADVVRWQWSPPVWITCNNCAEPVTQPKADITYIAQAYNAGNCTATDKISITTLCNGTNIFVPNTFSPNNDGINDWFYPRGKGDITVRSFRIFNRLGKVVFDKGNSGVNTESDGWNGNVAGTAAPADVYVYVIEIVCANYQILTVKGNISLLR